ncbi:hypothetical protein lerEdw1_020754 [Lerista edwardsae]|nr:hypothetical protein lerEdw1_020754 [Lerista edwardsae]
MLTRFRETLKQCQDLKTEKGQMDRRISQLLEENGDLSSALVFLGGESVPALKSRAVGNRHRPKLWDFARALTELQESEAELSEEHSTALKEWEERRAGLERELHSALAEKKCLEERIEILQGTIFLLEDQLKENGSLPEKGEVMGDVLKVGAGPRRRRRSSEQSEPRREGPDGKPVTAVLDLGCSRALVKPPRGAPLEATLMIRRVGASSGPWLNLSLFSLAAHAGEMGDIVALEECCMARLAEVLDNIDKRVSVTREDI